MRKSELKAILEKNEENRLYTNNDFVTAIFMQAQRDKRE